MLVDTTGSDWAAELLLPVAGVGLGAERPGDQQSRWYVWDMQ